MQTVAELRKQGFRIRVAHYRYYFDYDNDELMLLHKKDVEDANYLYEVIDPNPSPRGGETIVEITSPDNQNASGEARCSLADNYVKRYGVTKALGRAMAQLSHNEKEEHVS